MKFLLDTHTLIWVTEGSKRIPKCIREAEASECVVSVASLYEMHFKAANKTFEVAASVGEYLKANRSPILAITEQDALVAARLPLIHGDPIDRLLIAQAKNRSLIIVTADSRVLQYPVKTLEI